MKNELFRQFNQLLGIHRLVWQEVVRGDPIALEIARANLEGAEIRRDTKAIEAARAKLDTLQAARRAAAKQEAAVRPQELDPITAAERKGAEIRAKMAAPREPNWLDRTLAKWGNAGARENVERWKAYRALEGWKRDYAAATNASEQLIVLKDAGVRINEALAGAKNPNDVLVRYGIAPMEGSFGSDQNWLALGLALNAVMGDHPTSEADIAEAVAYAEGKGPTRVSQAVARAEE